MKTIRNLTKIYFKETICGLFGTKSKRSTAKNISAVAIAVVLIVCSMGYSLWNIGSALNAFGFASNIILLGAVLSVIMSLMITISDAQGYLYKTNDYATLISMPIKFSHIITAKYLSAYLTTVLYSSLILLPTYVVYFILCPITVEGIIFAVLSLFFIPTFAQFCSCFLSWLINIISSKIANKSMFRTFISLFVVAGFSIFIYFANSDVMGAVFAVETPQWFNVVFSSIHFIFVAITTKSFLWFFVSLGISLAFAFLGIGIVLIGYKKINSSYMTTKAKKSTKQLSYKQHSITFGLLKKELSKLFNSPVYCVNVLMGPIMSFVIMGVCISLRYSLGDIDPNVNLVMAGIELFSVAMMLGVMPLTSISISLEGKNFHTIKSLPISFKNIATSKISLNLIFALPTALLTTLIFAISTNLTILQTLVMLLYLVLQILVFTIMGLLINLKMPKLNWTNETQVVKQSGSMVTTMLISMATTVVPMSLFFVCLAKMQNFSPIIFILSVSAVVLVLLITLIAILIKKGNEMYQKIS